MSASKWRQTYAVETRPHLVPKSSQVKSSIAGRLTFYRAMLAQSAVMRQ